MVTLREIVVIHDLHRQGLGISAIARQTGLDRKTVRKYLKQGLQTPHYGPRQPRPRLLDHYEGYLRERIAAHPGLSARRLWREIAELGYGGGYTTLTDLPRDVRPPAQSGFERRFETPPGKQAQVDFAQFKVAFEDEPGRIRTIHFPHAQRFLLRRQLRSLHKQKATFLNWKRTTLQSWAYRGKNVAIWGGKQVNQLKL